MKTTITTAVLHKETLGAEEDPNRIEITFDDSDLHGGRPIGIQLPYADDTLWFSVEELEFVLTTARNLEKQHE